MKQTPPSSDSHTKNALSIEQHNHIERNLELSINERINQLPSAVDLIEEMRNSLKEINENRLQNLAE